jgi:hypothetical protein
MMKKTLVFIILALAASLSFAADIAPTFSWRVNTELLVEQKISIRRGGTINLRPTFISNGSVMDLSECTSVALVYRALGLTNCYVVTGGVHSVTGGVANIRWTSACELTNSVLWGDIKLYSSTTTVVRCPIRIQMADDASYQASTSTPTAFTSIDWLTVLNSNQGYAPFPYLIGAAVSGQTIKAVSPTQWIPTDAGSGDMRASVYDPSNTASRVAFYSELTNHTGKTGTAAHGLGSASTNNTGDFATAAEGDSGTNAQARVAVVEGYTNEAHTAYGWGNHASAGYAANSGLSSATQRITAVEGYTNEAHTAYGWGNHASAGYAANSGLSSATQRITAVEGYTNEAHTAYGWGNHASAGYAANSGLSSATQRITAVEGYTNEAHTAYGWGNHSTSGYLGTNQAGGGPTNGVYGLTNGFYLSGGRLNGTNGVYFYNSSNGTNYWFLTP